MGISKERQDKVSKRKFFRHIMERHMTFVYIRTESVLMERVMHIRSGIQMSVCSTALEPISQEEAYNIPSRILPESVDNWLGKVVNVVRHGDGSFTHGVLYKDRVGVALKDAYFVGKKRIIVSNINNELTYKDIVGCSLSLFC